MDEWSGIYAMKLNVNVFADLLRVTELDRIQQLIDELKHFQKIYLELH